MIRWVAEAVAFLAAVSHALSAFVLVAAGTWLLVIVVKRYEEVE